MAIGLIVDIVSPSPPFLSPVCVSFLSIVGYCHNSPAKELADGAKFISAPLQRILKHIMSIGRVFLGFPKCSNVIVGSSAFWALHVFIIDLIQASLMERVFTQEVHFRQVKSAATCCTSLRVKGCRLVAQFVHFFPLGVGLRSVALDQAAVLSRVNR